MRVTLMQTEDCWKLLKVITLDVFWSMLIKSISEAEPTEASTNKMRGIPKKNSEPQSAGEVLIIFTI